MECRDLSETKTIKIDDAEFVIRFIPRKIWRKISGRFSSAMKVLSKYPKNAPLPFDDPECRQMNTELEEVYRDLASYGVARHANLKKKDGSEIQFETKLEDGRLPDQLLEIYDLNGLLPRIGNEIILFNSMTETDQKN